jgi:amino acid adenylation domain-containing protein
VSLYNEAITVHRRGPLDIAALQRAMDEILRRHEIWRSAITLIDGQPHMLVRPEVSLRIAYLDLAHLPAEERERRALDLAAEDARAPFKLDEAPLLRARLVRMGPDVHRLLITLHHIIFDGVSIYRLFMPELAKLYAVYADGGTPPPPGPRLQYGDYALWRERQLETAPFTRELAYWRETLGEEPPELNLPADRSPPATPSYRGSMECFTLSRQTTDQLKALSRQEGVTLYATLLAAFKAMLHRYSGQEDMVIGGVTDMRRRPELQPVMGYFLNSLALRTRPKPDLPFTDYLQQVQASVIGALDASNLPFDRVVRALRPRRTGGRHPLFQVLFSVEPPAPRFADGWDLTQMDVVVGAAKFDLYLELDEYEGRLIGRFLYSTDLFEAASIRRMIGHWQTLLAAIVNDPHALLGDLPLLSGAERAEVLIGRNQTQRATSPETLPTLIEAQAKARPEAIAVIADGRAWRYRQLMARADVLAARLHQAGLGDGALAAIAMERSFDLIAALLAILRLGAAYLPIDTALPRARIAQLLDDAAPALVLTDTASLGALPRTAARTVIADGANDRAIPAPSPTAGGPQSLAYVLYTSGSTGRPKAVEVARRAVVNLLAAVGESIGFGPDDGLLAVTTLSFDIAALELFLPLVAGGRLILASRDEAGDPGRLVRRIHDSGCTVIQATPATFRGLLANGWAGDSRLKILCGGEALPAALAAELLSRGAGLWNMYGPTETTIWSLIHKVRPGDDPVPIGRPLANTQVFIVDRHDALVPDLVPGQLLIGGDGVALGYRGDPALTAAKFVRLPHLAPGRLYRTGDLARWRADGTVEFLGRLDNQAKIRGYRVGVEEVEAALAQHPRIAACAVRAAPDASGEASLTAYLVGPGLSETEIPGIRARLREVLPAYMAPSRYHVLPSLPLTANGKIDRRRLPGPTAPASAGAASPPRDDLERLLADLFQECLGVGEIGRDDDFFELGGHSLLACILMAKIQGALGRELPLVTFFRAPTIATLADHLRAPSVPKFAHLVPLRTAGQGRPLFIVHGIFGNVLQLRDLAELLEAPRPVYALQARGADPREAPHTRIEEMAEAYLAAIREVQDSGPYALAGYSFGGLIAYEMGVRLRAAGEAVDLLAMLETDLHDSLLPLPGRLAHHASWPARVARRLIRLPPKMLGPYVLGKLRRLGAGSVLPDDFAEIGGLSPQMLERYRRMYAIGVDEFRRFRPGAFDGRLSVFRSRGPRFDACDPMPIWRRAAAAVDLFEIEGRHERIMERPFVETLAAQLSRCIAKADGQAPRKETRTMGEGGLAALRAWA